MERTKEEQNWRGCCNMQNRTGELTVALGILESLNGSVTKFKHISEYVHILSIAHTSEQYCLQTAVIV